MNLLWVYHLIFCIVFYVFVLKNYGDALNYWNTVKETNAYTFIEYIQLGYGTYFMYALNYFPSRILELSFLTGSMVYALLGYVGFVYFYYLFKKRISFNTKLFNIYLFPALFFLPNLHFWTCNIGKDTLLFLCIALFSYGMQKPLKHLFLIIFSISLAYLVRPHIVFYLIFSFSVAMLIAGNLKVYQKILFIVIVSLIFIPLIDKTIAYLNIESIDYQTLSNYSNDKVTKLSRDYTGSRVDMSNYSFPFKIFTFLYRPLFFDFNGVLSIVASLENLLLLLLTIKFIFTNPLKIFLKGDYILKAFTIFTLVGVVSFSLILGNLGIMLRQKNMFIPALLFIFLWGFSYQAEIKNNKELV
ncbi:MAG: hypothetical protein R2786_10885 [Flavobacteriaceae bacterium]